MPALSPMLLWLLLAGAAYLVGSVPFGFLIARARGVDIRAHGSGNIGATNVGRVLGKRLGALCFALDVLKGLLPTLAAGWAAGLLGGASPGPADAFRWMGVAAAAIVGHMFPVWLGFRGGKGVATGFGALLGVFPVLTGAALGALAVWLVSARLTRYVGVSSCLAAVSLPAWALLAGWWLVGENAGSENAAGAPAQVWPYLVVTAALAALVVFKHRGNLRRTMAGTEPRLGERGSSPS